MKGLPGAAGGNLSRVGLLATSWPHCFFSQLCSNCSHNRHWGSLGSLCSLPATLTLLHALHVAFPPPCPTLSSLPDGMVLSLHPSSSPASSRKPSRPLDIQKGLLRFALSITRWLSWTTRQLSCASRISPHRHSPSWASARPCGESRAPRMGTTRCRKAQL